MTQITPRIYIANGDESQDTTLAQRLSLTGIVSTALEYHIQDYHRIPVYKCGLRSEASERDINTDEAIQHGVNSLALSLSQSEGEALVQSSTGGGRAVAVVVGYLVLSGECPTVKAACALVRKSGVTITATPRLIAHVKRLYDPEGGVLVDDDAVIAASQKKKGTSITDPAQDSTDGVASVIEPDITESTTEPTGPIQPSEPQTI